MRPYCKQITKHGQETMMFKCDQCGHEVAIDAYDMFVAEFNEASKVFKDFRKGGH